MGRDDESRDDFRRVETCDEIHKGTTDRLDKLESTMERVVNRLPLWATFLMTGGGAIIGILGTGLVERALGLR